MGELWRGEGVQGTDFWGPGREQLSMGLGCVRVQVHIGRSKFANRFHKHRLRAVPLVADIHKHTLMSFSHVAAWELLASGAKRRTDDRLVSGSR